MKREPCLIWSGYITQHGYGQTGRNTLVHRQVWEEANGPVPDGKQIHHLCQNRACYRLSHLELLLPKEHAEKHVEIRGPIPCGSMSAYINKRCRCPECRAANAANQREVRRRVREAA